jgi:hypothetical protein
MTPNKVNATLSPDDQEAVLTAIAGIRQKLPFLIALTTAERQATVKLGDKSHMFVKKALDVATQNPGVLPASITVEDVRNGVQLFEGLTAIRIAVDQLQKQIDDTTMQAGSEAYAKARVVYTCAKAGFAGAGLKTAAEDLGKRFGRKTRAAAASDSVESSSTTPATTSAASS